MAHELDHTTLIVTYACTFLALACILVRLLCRRIRGERCLAFRDDLWMGISVVPLLVRLGVIHVVLLYGTNSIAGDLERMKGVGPEEIERRVVGSKLVLVSRIGHPAFMWCMKACVLAFLGRLMSAEPKYARALRVTGWALVATFVGVVLSNTLECRPFRMYYQVVPDPGNQCTKGVAQLYTLGSTNIATDIALIVLPLPLIYKSHLPLIRKIQLFILFGVGIFLIAITVARMPVISDAPGMQQNRTLWASIEILASCLVANAPILNNFIQEFRHKRARRKAHGGKLGGGSGGNDTEDGTVVENGSGVKISSDLTLREGQGQMEMAKKNGRRGGGGGGANGSEETLTLTSAAAETCQHLVGQGNHCVDCPYAVVLPSPEYYTNDGYYTLHSLNNRTQHPPPPPPPQAPLHPPSTTPCQSCPCSHNQMIIQTSTSVVQTINNRSSLPSTPTLNYPTTTTSIHHSPSPASRYYKGDFLGTQVWADPAVFPGPKDPSQHVMYGMNFSHMSSSSGGFGGSGAGAYTAECYRKRRQCCAAMADVDLPGLGILPSRPPMALLKAISNARRQAMGQASSAVGGGGGSGSASGPAGSTGSLRSGGGSANGSGSGRSVKKGKWHGRGESEESFGKAGDGRSSSEEGSFESKETGRRAEI